MGQKTPAPSAILLFDGDCSLCSRTVQFVIPRDRQGRVKFASLQSEAGQQLLERHGLPAQGADTVVLIEDGRSYVKSTAALRLLRCMSGLWPVLYALIIVPLPLRDRVYDWVARNRYRWFGKQSSCLMPTPEIRERFLD
ncbi:thiol-disulfide oxidoreductase DCC family protein [Brevibacillus massiliensis]|jgi:predicted DCC family thiol-disulfide oxidoreductase YuxK|uniref:thiol-disulfide oxidoreductase DCC family protein n=1 Tax=Brevibacillus massiliensis TaxID=1118054 RepID=UPI0002F325F1|nr:thiol-disulfide oxidoreductase DCC family protein [Brevibacillus massiliensis]